MGMQLYPPLCIAVLENASVERIKLLIELKADVNFSNYKGETALSLAQMYNRKPIMEVLTPLSKKTNFQNQNSIFSF